MGNRVNPISSINEDLLLENKYYKEFLKEKEKIKEKYPQDLWDRPHGLKQNNKLKYNNHDLWREYIKELLDLMLKPNGTYQEFVWDNYSESEKNSMEAKARGRKQGGTRNTEFNYY